MNLKNAQTNNVQPNIIVLTKTDVFEEGTRVQVPIQVKKIICAVDAIKRNKVTIFLLDKNQVILKRFVKYCKHLVMVIIRYCKVRFSPQTQRHFCLLLRTLSSYNLERHKPTISFT